MTFDFNKFNMTQFKPCNNYFRISLYIFQASKFELQTYRVASSEKCKYQFLSMQKMD